MPADPQVFVLTVLQPVASAMVEPDAGGFGDDGGFVPRKPIENRGWRPSVIPAEGLLVAIRAGAKWWASNAAPGSVRGKPRTTPDPHGLAWVRERWSAMPPADALPTSAVLGCVRVRAAVDIRGDVPPGMWDGPRDVAARSPWTLGPIAWIIDRGWRLPKPMPWSLGEMGLRPAAPEIAAACLAAGARVAA